MPPSELEAVVHRLAGPGGARLADMFAADGDAVTLRLIWSIDGGSAAGPRYLVTESVVDGQQYPALSDIAPAAFVEECEIYEQFAVRPATGKPMNRVMLPPHGGAELPRLGHRPERPPEDVHAPHTVGGQAFEFPFGPVRQVGVESPVLRPGHQRRGNRRPVPVHLAQASRRGVAAARPDIARGGVLRGARRGTERRRPRLGVRGSGRGGGRDLAGAPSSRGPGRSRLELERLYNHAAAIAALCQATGLTVGQSAAEIALERLLRLNAAAFGHRYLFGVVEPGGTRRAPDSEALRRGLPGAYGELCRATDALLATNSFLDRLEATGILTAEQGPAPRPGGAGRAGGRAGRGRTAGIAVRRRAAAGKPVCRLPGPGGDR